MAIVSISTDWGVDPRIIRITTTDSLATITTAGYLTAQASNIEALQNGDFEWTDTDYCLVAYSDGESFFTHDSTNNTFLTTGVMTSQFLITSAQIQGMDAAPVLILPAAGVGKLYILNRIVGLYQFGTTQYTGGGALGLEWANTAALAGPAASSTLAGATFNGYAASNAFELTPDNTDTFANLVNKGVYLSNNTAAFATGDGTLVLNINYQIENA